MMPAFRDPSEQEDERLLREDHVAKVSSIEALFASVEARLAAIEAKLDGLAKTAKPTGIYVKSEGITIGENPHPEGLFAGFTGSLAAESSPHGLKVVSIEGLPKGDVTLAPAASWPFAEVFSPRGENKVEKSS